MLLFTHLRFESSNTLRDAHKLLRIVVWREYTRDFCTKYTKMDLYIFKYKGFFVYIVLFSVFLLIGTVFAFIYIQKGEMAC